MATLNIENFLPNFAAQFEDTDAASITADTVFREIEEWDSLIALSLIAVADEEYQVKLTGDDIRNAKTVNDLFETIKSKL